MVYFINMKQQRLNGLSDGIFAIVMTLLALELHLPDMAMTTPDSYEILRQLVHIIPSFLSFLLSFTLLFTYWRSHHFLTSVYAKNLSVGLANYNALFFFFITMIPFSSQVLGKYSEVSAAIAVYGINVIAIGVTLLMMRMHIERSRKIDTAPISRDEWRSGYIRIVLPIIAAVMGIIVGFYNPALSVGIFIFSILFNLVPFSSNLIYFILDLFFVDEYDTLVSSNYDPRHEYRDVEMNRRRKQAIHQRFRNTLIKPIRLPFPKDSQAITAGNLTEKPVREEQTHDSTILE